MKKLLFLDYQSLDQLLTEIGFGSIDQLECTYNRDSADTRIDFYLRGIYFRHLRTTLMSIEAVLGFINI